MNYNKKLFLENIKALNIDINSEAEENLDKYAGMLIKKNKVMNLTAITDPDGVAVKHFADSLSIINSYDFKESSKVIDIGTGAGFPGIPLLIAKPQINLTMMDSTAKRMAFVKECIESLSLSAEVIHGRAEEFGKNPDYREKFDVAVARGVARLSVLFE